jgi:hypothetical protein
LKQTTTRETGGFVLSGEVKQRKHEPTAVSFCDPVLSTGFSKQTITAPKENACKMNEFYTSMLDCFVLCIEYYRLSML